MIIRFLPFVFACTLTNACLAADPAISGKFTGNGKDAKLAFVSAQKGEPFADKPTIVLIFSEMDHSKDRRARIKAGFGD